MNHLTRNHLIALLGAILAFFAVVAGIVILSSSMRKREVRVLEARDYLASFEQNKRTFAEEAQELEAILGRVESLEAQLLTRDAVPALLSLLEQTVQAHGTTLTITSVTEQTSDSGALEAIHVDFSAEGAFESVEQLLRTFRAQAYQVQFDKVSLFQSEKGWQLLGSITVTSFQ